MRERERDRQNVQERWGGRMREREKMCVCERESAVCGVMFNTLVAFSV
jgi:hypothetical protein